MTATNHALTGALIGLTIHQPLLAIPAAFASHYVLDALPHGGGFISVKSKAFVRYLLVEAVLCGLLVFFLAVRQPANWWLAAICAFVATTPDFMWIKGFVALQKGKREPKPRYWFVKLHSKVQWFERPIGSIVEIAWAAAAITFLVIIVK